MTEWFGTEPARGSFKMLQSKTPKVTTMYALCWADRKAKCLISNRGTSLPGNVSYDRRIQRPQMVELFFSKFSVIDVHDHLRQGSLEMERTWHTMQWEHRLLATVVTTAADFRDDVAPPTHTLYAFSTLPQYKRLSGTILCAQRKCSICGRKASFYCSGCSDPLQNNFFGVCGLKTGRDCHSLHLNTTLG
ncbi:Bifunctional aspartate aminotransferase [Phytophthora cinnamomi]|uniref:Bifunctional aspartate aminotransferase n=1 Tax=Phytophthora cinnamomi TaxID=4785 RepID=UPI00355AC329|nr:Bifunctional aspartate aminotransferase [Phytophthora cinnamomi]